MKLKGGVFIIGSLYWQDHRDSEGEDTKRKDWRDQHLDMQSVINAKVPIKYGRFSSDFVYTMVFDNQLDQDQFGTAKAIAFSHNPFTEFSQLKFEVESLSEIEGRHDKTFIKGQMNESVAWCVCGIIFNPRVDEKDMVEILTKWGQQLKSNQKGYKAFIKEPDLYSLKKSGELDVPWPENVDNLDFLIATSTRPEGRDGIENTSILEIANHVKNREYFRPNIVSGIKTYQDKAILKQLFEIGINEYHKKIDSEEFHRFCSWNHCFEAFRSEKNSEYKALHLAMFLASWGMYRGSGGLLQKDYQIHVKAIEILSKKEYSKLDCAKNEISKSDIDLILKLKIELYNYYAKFKFERMGQQYTLSPTNTLMSKILLGTLACIPAYDQYFVSGLKLSGIRNNHFNKPGLTSLFGWANELDVANIKLKTKADKNYPNMKLIDMYFWGLGYNRAINKNDKKGL